MAATVKVELPRELERLPDEIRERTRTLLDLAGTGIAKQAQKNLRGREGVGGNIRISSRREGGDVVVEAAGAGARAQESGAYIKPTRKKALRFVVDGRTVITKKPVRLKGKRYMARAVAARRRMIDRAAEQAFRGFGG